MEIEYYTKTVYGNDLMYVANNEEAERALIRLTGRLTVSESDMAALGVFGITFKEVLPPKK